MVSKVFEEVGNVVDGYSGLSRRVLDYVSHMKVLIDASKQPGFAKERWHELAEYVDADEFQRVGNFKEEMDYEKYIGFLSNWAPTCHWEGSFKRIGEQDNVVILELEERITADGHSDAVNSVTVYEFNPSDKVRHLDVYLQKTPAGEALSPAYG